MANIIVTAENFAFGPVGKLITITDALIKNGHNVTFLGYGTALQLAKKAKFKEIIELNTDGVDFESTAKDIFTKFDLLITCMDRSSLILAQKLKLPNIWIDTLFWWWDEIPDYMQKADLYIKQNSVNDQKNMNKYASLVQNLHGVGPIVDMKWSGQTKTKQILVAFGGMEGAGWYTVGKDTNYPYTICEMLINSVNFKDYEKVKITGNERILSTLAIKYKSYSKFEFSALNHEDFLKELGRSSLALIVPGLETPLEVFAYRVPAIYLPPSNSSQYVQLDEFVKNGVVKMAIHLRDFYPPLMLDSLDLKEKMKVFLEQLRIYESDKSALEISAREINRYLNDNALQDAQLSAQDQYYAKLGTNGLNEALDLIDIFISNIKK